MHVLWYKEGSWQGSEVESDENLRAAAFGPELVWIRATGSTPPEFTRLGELFELHPLALEDVQNARQRPKVEDYPGVTFVVVRVPVHDGKETEWTQVGIFTGKDFVLTASTRPNPVLDEAERRLVAGKGGLPIDRADRILYFLVDVLVDAYFPFLARLQDQLEELEEQVLQRATRMELARIQDLKGEISRIRRTVVPMREAMLSLERNEHPNVAAGTRTYLRDVADHMIRIHEQVEHVKEVALIAQESWNASLANAQNETMRRLTVVAALLLVPSLLAGLGGMNFVAGFPDWSFPGVVAAILGFVLLGFLTAKWRKWL